MANDAAEREDARELARIALSVTAGWFPIDLTDVNEGHRFSAAAWARCRRLLAGMVALDKADMVDAMTVLARSLADAALYSLYALLAPTDEVLGLLEAEQAWHEAKISKALELKYQPATVGTQPNAKAMFDKVTALVGTDEVGRTATKFIYDGLFRTASYSGTHVPLSQLEAHLDGTPGGAAVVTETRMSSHDDALILLPVTTVFFYIARELSRRALAARYDADLIAFADEWRKLRPKRDQ